MTFELWARRDGPLGTSVWRKQKETPCAKVEGIAMCQPHAGLTIIH